MNDETLRALGKLVPEGMQRDAVHIAVVPVVADSVLKPGERVAIVDGMATPSWDGIGVVDPFLRDFVKNGERFWLFLNPGSITSLRHEWTHPAFPAAVPPP